MKLQKSDKIALGSVALTLSLAFILFVGLTFDSGGPAISAPDVQPAAGNAGGSEAQAALAEAEKLRILVDEFDRSVNDRRAKITADHADRNREIIAYYEINIEKCTTKDEVDRLSAMSRRHLRASTDLAVKLMNDLNAIAGP